MCVKEIDISCKAERGAVSASEKRGAGYVACIGMFDGVHLGHQHLLEYVKQLASEKGLESMAITFDRAPLEVVREGWQQPLLTPRRAKVEQLFACGVDAVGVLKFTKEMAALSSGEFIKEVLHERLGVKVLVLGYDNRFGSDRPQELGTYVQAAAPWGIEVRQYEPLMEGAAEISSSRVREQLQAGRVERAAELLGRCYALRGSVVGGHRVGRLIGYPTANILPESVQQIVPCEGVYAVRIYIEGGVYGAMLYIGRRPTLNNGKERSIEANLFGYSGDAYGQEVDVEFVAYLRSDHRFESLEALSKQLGRDAEEAQRVLEHQSASGGGADGERHEKRDEAAAGEGHEDNF